MHYAYGMTNNEVDTTKALNDFITVEAVDIIGANSQHEWFTLISGDIEYAHTNNELLEDVEVFVKVPGSAVKAIAESLALEGFVVLIYRHCINDISALVRNKPIGQCEADDTFGTTWTKH
jgi:hypothetical protein